MKPRIVAASVAAQRHKVGSYGTDGHRFESCRGQELHLAELEERDRDPELDRQHAGEHNGSGENGGELTRIQRATST
jgi:hypothetical protein